MTRLPPAPVHPVQTKSLGRNARAMAPKAVTQRAYEVFCHVYGAQPALFEVECRGGFRTGELIAFLYAHSFPKDEWRSRVHEAFNGMENL